MATQKPPTAAKTPVGGYVLSDKPIEINAGRPTVKIKVRNTGDHRGPPAVLSRNLALRPFECQV